MYKIRRCSEIRSRLELRPFILLLDNDKKIYQNIVASRMLVDYLNI